MLSKLIIAKTLLNEMQEYVTRYAPLEACGLLAGKKDRVEKMIGVRNQAQSPVRFVMDPYEQLTAFDLIESNRMTLLGIFHSHPAGPETVSPTDIAEAAYEVIHVILSQKSDKWTARGFWIENREAREVTLQIVE